MEGTRLLRWRNLESKGETRYQLVLASTPFYPEGGGQVGDKGILRFGKQEIEVLDTVKENDLILHITEEFPQQPDETVHAMIASERRNGSPATIRQHTCFTQHCVKCWVRTFSKRIPGSSGLSAF